MTSDSLQTDLFAGNSALKLERRTEDGHPVAEQLPVASVLVDSDVPHLDRLFDYLVPAELADAAQPGVRVRVRLNGTHTTGYLRFRLPASDFAGKLHVLEEVISPIPVVNEEIFLLAQELADRYAGMTSQVLRLAIPPRIVRAEKDFVSPENTFVMPPNDSRLDESLDLSVGAEIFAPYLGGNEFLEDLSAGVAARACMAVVPGAGASWDQLLSAALTQVAAESRGALAIVPDAKSLHRLEETLATFLPAGSFVRLSGADKPTERYTAFLKVLTGEIKIVIGTRSAAYAPVADLSLVACWDDGDSNHIEQRSPYCHARDILLLRATNNAAAALFAGHAMTVEAARLVRTRWASYLSVDRETLRASTPRVFSSKDDSHRVRDPLAAVARIPHLAFETARAALVHGPVLVQVTRSGYIPALSCQRCLMPARCTVCRGPLKVEHSGAQAHCDWCGRIEQSWSCFECGSQRWRSTIPGALRTAEELGRAFPGVPVLSSSGENILETVSNQSALVVATPGAEPVAQEGYAAALLLDADSMLRHDSLRAPEQALRRWFNAAALVRSYSDGGRVISTAGESVAFEALVRWDPAGFALQEMDERAELGLPPAVRTAAITGDRQTIELWLEELDVPATVVIRGPVDLELEPDAILSETELVQSRIILFIPYAVAAETTHYLRAKRAALAALRKGRPVQIRCDGLDIL